MLDERTGKALQTRDESGSTSSPTMCHPGVSRRRAIGSIAMFVAFILLSACTDYVSQIEDRIEERERASIINQSSDDSRFTSSDSRSGLDPESSNSSEKPSSDKVVDPAEVTSGTMTDSRDGQTYKTVTIGSQTWMAENLNYETANSYCYNDNAANCTKYGRLYTWAAAMDSAGTWSTNGKGCGYNKTCSPTGTIRGVCPEGWHLPTNAEFETLFTAVGGSSNAGTKLKSTSGWNEDNGTDDYSFSALPAGYRSAFSSYNRREGDGANFWSSTGSDSSDAYYMYLYYFGGNVELRSYSKDNGFSVRCVKDLQVE